MYDRKNGFTLFLFFLQLSTSLSEKDALYRLTLHFSVWFQWKVLFSELVFLKAELDKDSFSCCPKFYVWSIKFIEYKKATKKILIP